MNYLKTFEEISESYNKPRAGGKKRWTIKYKKTINCSNAKGFSQKQYCKRKRKGGVYKNESVESVMGGLIDKVGKVVMSLNDLCEQHLTYLLDDGFVYDVDINPDIGKDNSDLYDTGDIIIRLDKDERFSWDEIKDRFIPFLIMLNKDFNVLEEVQFNIESSDSMEEGEWFEIDTVCNDNDFDVVNIKEIIININI